MENIKETIQEQDLEVNVAEEEITKPDDDPQDIQKQQEGQQLQQHQEQQQQQQATEEQQLKAIEEQEEQEADKQIETSGVKILTEEQPAHQQQPETQLIDYEEEEEEDEDDDDDEEKETSQKLVIDIPEDEEEEEEEDEEKYEADDEVIALEEFHQEETTAKEMNKISPKSEEVEAIITLSDGEGETPINESATKPGKVQKRRSMGAASVTGNNEEEHYRLKRRKINAAGAPKMPLTGYVRYMNDRRESLRKEHPTKSAMEHTKMIGEEWHALSADVKSSYLKAADVDKQRYVKELHTFFKSRPDILASELAKNKVRKTAESNSPNPTTSTAAAAVAATAINNTTSLAKEKIQTNDNNTKITKDNAKEKMSKESINMPSTSQQAAEKTVNEKAKRKRTPTPPTSTATASSINNNATNVSTTTSSSSNSNTNINALSIVTPTPGEIPIFTNEFLEHNKIYDMELRSLRKSKTDLEQQNSVLEKHVENMKFGVEKMITENNELEEKNRLLEIYLDKLKRKLALALSSLPLPTAPNGATVDNIDKYMQDLYKMSTSNSHGPATLNKAKDIIRKLDLQIQL